MNKYQMILSVCETHSISKTAEQLNYTQSGISQAIKSYESELGFPLFKRSKNGMELMPNVEEIVESLRTICKEQHRIAQIASNISSLDSGHIRIGTIQSISYHWLPGILESFSKQYPKIHFDITVAGFQELKRKLKDGRLDCVFTSKYSVPEYEFFELGRDELMLVTPSDHKLAQKIIVSLADVDGESFLLSSDGLNYETGQIFELNNIHPNIKYHINEDYMVVRMVEHGFGISILPKLLLYDIPFNVSIRSFSEHYSRILGIAYNKHTGPNLATIKFIEFTHKCEYLSNLIASTSLSSASHIKNLNKQNEVQF